MRMNIEASSVLHFLVLSLQYGIPIVPFSSKSYARASLRRKELRIRSETVMSERIPKFKNT